MKWTDDGSACTLSSGRTLNAYAGTFSLPKVVKEAGAAPSDVLAYGYDSTVKLEHDDNGEIALTPDERREIAEEMIARWRKWGGLSEEARSDR